MMIAYDGSRRWITYDDCVRWITREGLTLDELRTVDTHDGLRSPEP
jgi:hypothetical protein